MNLTLDQIVALYNHPATAPYMRDFLTGQGIAAPADGSAIRSMDQETLDWLHDAAAEALLNEGPIVETFQAEMDKGVFPIHIQGIEGAYIVRAQEFDDSNPMASMVEARRYVDWEFGEFLVSHEEDADRAEADDDAIHRCQYCNSDQGCEHLLLVVDMTFRDAEGGPLYELFNERWYAIQSEASDESDFREGDAFDACIEEVEQVAGPGDGFDFDGGPGRSSHDQIWYLPSKEEVAAAVAAYRRLIGAESRQPLKARLTALSSGSSPENR